MIGGDFIGHFALSDVLAVLRSFLRDFGYVFG